VNDSTATMSNPSNTRRDPGGGMAFWVLVAIAAGALAFIFAEAMGMLEAKWRNTEEYSHGYLLPLITLFLAWQKRYELAVIDMRGSWLGGAVLVGGLVLYVMGDLATLFVIEHYAFVVALIGLVWAVVGDRAMRLLALPLAFLFLMVPLPSFLYNNLSQQLQLISSELGVAVIRWFGISVYLEGNVIDLGTYKLQVVEACNGLRYLFPLMSFGLLAAYMFHAPLWQRVVVFLSTMPITVLMNSFRIGVIGVMVDNFGIEHAEGFLHFFEGWVIFMACIAILLLEMLVLMRLTGDRRPFRTAFGFDAPEPIEGAERPPLRVHGPLVAAVAVVLAAAAGSQFLEERQEVTPPRAVLDAFPMELGVWEGRRDALDPEILEALAQPDYVIADFRNPQGDWVNFYVAYYPSQRSGSSAHSPRSCIPGGGWEIKDLKTVRLDDVRFDGAPLQANRLQIQKGEYRQLVYYWFKQRDRLLTNEYLVKWYLFWDALTRNRTDGALVRLTTVLDTGESWSEADSRLVQFARNLPGRLESHLPD
jgi:exosortase D (VPLPA-CTERM-specific)